MGVYGHFGVFWRSLLGLLQPLRVICCNLKGALKWLNFFFSNLLIYFASEVNCKPLAGTKCSKSKPWPPAPQGGLNYDIWSKWWYILTLWGKISRWVFWFFVISFLKLSHYYLNFRKIMTIFVHNMQTGECHPYMKSSVQTCM